jgi:hypothetical protein
MRLIRATIKIIPENGRVPVRSSDISQSIAEKVTVKPIQYQPGPLRVCRRCVNADSAERSCACDHLLRKKPIANQMANK